MTQTITLRIWNKQEGKVTKTVKVDNVLSVSCESVFKSIGFFGDDIEIFVFPEFNNIEFDFTSDKRRVFIKITKAEEE